MARYIDAEEITQRVRNEIKEQMVLTSDIGFMAFLQGFLKLFEQKIREEPTADVEEIRHSKLVQVGSELFYPQCSECGKYIKEESNYCPKCGAKIDKESEKQ